MTLGIRTASDTAATHISDHNIVHMAMDDMVISVMDPAYGVTADGSTDDTTAIQAAADAAAAAGAVLWFPAKTYYVTSTLIFKCDVKMARLSIIQTDQDIACVQIGADDADLGAVDIDLASIKQTSQKWSNSGGTGTLSTDMGVKICRVVYSKITYRVIQNFSYGIEYKPSGGGFAYNTITHGRLDNNAVNEHMKPGNSAAWTNQNTFIGGNYLHNSLPDDGVTGTAHILVEMTSGASKPNGNLWLNPSLEGDVAEWQASIGGNWNKIDHARSENTTSGRWRFVGLDGSNKSQFNTIIEQSENQPSQATQTNADANFVGSYNSWLRSISSGATGLALNNTSGSGVGVISIYDAGTEPQESGTTLASDYTVEIASDFIRMKPKATAAGSDPLEITKEGRVTMAKLQHSATASGTSLGSVTNKVEIFDENGSSVGFIPIYDAIT